MGKYMVIPKSTVFKFVTFKIYPKYNFRRIIGGGGHTEQKRIRFSNCISGPSPMFFKDKFSCFNCLTRQKGLQDQ